MSTVAFFTALTCCYSMAQVARQDAAPSHAQTYDGLPAAYASRFKMLGDTLYDERQGLTTVFGNDLVAAAADNDGARYADGSVIVMEFAEARRDESGQLVRDAQGRPVKGSILHIDVMRRGSADGAEVATRAGAWEFASFRSDGATLVAPANAEKCASCHLKAGADKDFVFRLRSWKTAS